VHKLFLDVRPSVSNICNISSSGKDASRSCSMRLLLWLLSALSDIVQGRAHVYTICQAPANTWRTIANCGEAGIQSLEGWDRSFEGEGRKTGKLRLTQSGTKAENTRRQSKVPRDHCSRLVKVVRSFVVDLSTAGWLPVWQEVVNAPNHPLLKQSRHCAPRAMVLDILQCLQICGTTASRTDISLWVIHGQCYSLDISL
jgi:hypothetical protein